MKEVVLLRTEFNDVAFGCAHICGRNVKELLNYANKKFFLLTDIKRHHKVTSNTSRQRLARHMLSSVFMEERQKRHQ